MNEEVVGERFLAFRQYIESVAINLGLDVTSPNYAAIREPVQASAAEIQRAADQERQRLQEKANARKIAQLGLEIKIDTAEIGPALQKVREIERQVARNLDMATRFDIARTEAELALQALREREAERERRQQEAKRELERARAEMRRLDNQKIAVPSARGGAVTLPGGREEHALVIPTPEECRGVV